MRPGSGAGSSCNPCRGACRCSSSTGGSLRSPPAKLLSPRWGGTRYRIYESCTYYSSLGARQSALRCNHLRTDIGDTARDGPAGVMGLQFSQVAYVADVVPDAILLDVSPAHGLAGEVLDQTDAFQHRSAVLPAPAKVVDFARPRVFQEFFKRPDDVVAVDLIADLFPFIPIYRVHLAVEANLDQVRKEAMELHAGVGRAGQTSPAKDPDSHSEIAAVFLSQDVCGRFGCSEERVQAPVNPAGFVYTVVIFGIGIVIPRFQFRQRQLVGSVAVYLVGAHVDEHSIRTELPRGFEQIERADRIDFEVDEGHLARLVVGGLCGAVDNAVEPFLAKQREQSFPVSDV